MKSDSHELGRLVNGMRAAYARGDNATAWARANSALPNNVLVSTLIAYDLQAGSYVAYARENPSYCGK